MKISPAIELVYRRPGDLKPWPDNPRFHSAKQLAKLKASILNRSMRAAPVPRASSALRSAHYEPGHRPDRVVTVTRSIRMYFLLFST